MKSQVVKIAVIIMVAILAPTYCHAQLDGSLDFLQYKYNKEESEMLGWLSLAFEGNEVKTKSPEFNRKSKSYYALRSLRYQPRGEESSSHRYMVNGLQLDYSTSRLFTLLNISRYEGMGVTLYYIAEGQPKYLGYKLYGSITGRNHTGSLQFSSRNMISPYGVALNEDWVVSSATRITFGPDFYIDGVESNGFEVALSAYRKKLGNTLFFAIMLPYTNRGVRQYTSEEAFTLTNNIYYNPAWGIHNGKVRNSRHMTRFTPEAVAMWEHKLSAWTTMSITSRLRFEHSGRTMLGWYDSQTPKPDNYRYLPSFYTKPQDRYIVEDAWRNRDIGYTQVDWSRLYHTNAIQSDGQAAYALENRITNTLSGDLSILLRSQLRGVDLRYGIGVDYDSEHRFKRADDLLGADHLLNIDYFIVDDSTFGSEYRNNLRGTRLEVYEGEKFGYHYRLSSYWVAMFANAGFKIGEVDMEVGATLSTESFRRRGYFERELFSGNGSYGRSQRVTLYPTSVMVRGSYDFNNHMFGFGLEAMSKSPDLDALWLQPDYNNRLVDNPRTSISLRSYVEYGLVLQRLELRASLFASHNSRGSNVERYYDDFVGQYCDAVVRDLTYTNFGFEIDATVRWRRTLSSTFMLSAARYRYTKDARVTTYTDSSNQLVANSISAMRGLATGYPEIAVYGDITFSKDGWQATLSAQYWGSRHVAPSPIRRSERILSYTHSTLERNTLLSQQRLGDAATLNIELSKSFELKNDTALRISLSVENIIGSQIVYAGFEQPRTRRIENGHYSSVTPFANNICYAYGRTFRLNIGLTI